MAVSGVCLGLPDKLGKAVLLLPGSVWGFFEENSGIIAGEILLESRNASQILGFPKGSKRCFSDSSPRLATEVDPFRGAKNA